MCYGTALQQQLHKEICSNFELIASKQREACHKVLFLDAARQCNDASFWSNEFEAVYLAMGLQDLARECCSIGAWVINQGSVYAQAVAQGVVDSAWDFVHMVGHPVETIQHLGQAAWFVCDTLTLADEDSIGATLPFAQSQCQEKIDTIRNVTLAVSHTVSNSTGPQRVKMITKFGADCLFQHKAMQAVGAVAGIIKTQSRSMRTVEYVADFMGHEPAFATATESIAQATQELETVL